MKIWTKFGLLLSCLLISSNLSAFDPMDSLASEKLKPPIKLKICPLVITEWQINSPPNIPEVTKQINQICEEAILAFPGFVGRKHFKTASNITAWQLILLPLDRNSRHLNDPIRFQNRVNWNNSLMPGYTSHSLKKIFIFNQTNHPKFNTILTHEIFHALSYSAGIYNSHPGDLLEKNQADEKLAIEFTNHLGLGS